MSDKAETSNEPVLIKKYANRRLYHTGLSRHVTLDDVAKIVGGGQTIRVVDANTGADLTRTVLAQVMIEHQTPLSLIPVEMLHAALRYTGTDHQGAFAAFLSMVMRQFASMDTLWEKQVSMLLNGLSEGVGGGGAPVAPTSPAAPDKTGEPEDASPPPPESCEPARERGSEALTEARQQLQVLIDQMRDDKR